MDCNTARLMTLLSRPSGPGEFSADDLTALQSHLAECPSCRAQQASQSQFDRAVSQAMVSVLVPTDLEARLIRATLAAQGAALRMKLARYTVAASVLLVSALFGFGIYAHLRPSFDTRALADHFDREFQSPESTVREWLIDQSLPGSLPLDFDYQHHDFHGYARIQDHTVPVVVFKAWSANAPRPDMARVYIVRPGQFDLKSLQDAQTSFCNVQVIPEPRQGLAYVILFTSPNLDPFLKPLSRQLTQAPSTFTPGS